MKFCQIACGFSQKRIFNFHCIMGNPRSIIVTLSHDFLFFFRSRINKLSYFSFFVQQQQSIGCFNQFFLCSLFYNNLDQQQTIEYSRSSKVVAKIFHLSLYLTIHVIFYFFLLVALASREIFSQYFLAKHLSIRKSNILKIYLARLGRE